MIFRALLPVDAQSLERESSRSGDDGLAVLVILVRRPGVDGQHNRCAPSGPDDGIVICRAIHPQVPVLSPTAQSAGTAARMRWLPVVFPFSQSTNCCRCGAASAEPSVSFVSFPSRRAAMRYRAHRLGWRSSAPAPSGPDGTWYRR
jgi:hypothetical protein